MWYIIDAILWSIGDFRYLICPGSPILEVLIFFMNERELTRYYRDL